MAVDEDADGYAKDEESCAADRVEQPNLNRGGTEHGDSKDIDSDVAELTPGRVEKIRSEQGSA